MTDPNFQRVVLSPPAEIVTNHDSSSSTPGSVSKESPSDLLPVRRSTRDIKRKKFDDERVSSAIPTKSPLKKHRLSAEKVCLDQKPTTAVVQATPAAVLPAQSQPQINPIGVAVPAVEEKKPSIAAETVAEPVHLPPPTDPSPTPVQDLIPVPATASVPAVSLPSAGTVCRRSSSATVVAPSVVVKKENSTPKKRGRQPKKPPVTYNSVLANPAEVCERVAALKDIGRWQPTDDLALITAVMQTNDLTSVYVGVKFSCKFTLLEIQARWYALLYDPIISKLAQDSMKLLSPEVIAAVQSNTLFSREEEKTLAAISSTAFLKGSGPSLEVFEDLLIKHAECFHFARTARSLMAHWQSMKEFRLLNDQKPSSMSQMDQGMTFSDIEENFEDDEAPPADSVAERETYAAEKQLTRQIRHIENELPKLHVLVESVTGVSPPEFDTNTVAALRGRMVRYLMRSREATIGRNAKGNNVDIDLSLEGPVFKISRKQGTIKLRTTGDFYITNDGKRPIYVDGKPVLTNSKMKLNNNAVVEISCIRLIFMVNQDLINIMKSEGTKLMIA